MSERTFYPKLPEKKPVEEAKTDEIPEELKHLEGEIEPET